MPEDAMRVDVVVFKCASYIRFLSLSLASVLCFVRKLEMMMIDRKDNKTDSCETTDELLKTWPIYGRETTINSRVQSNSNVCVCGLFDASE